MITFLAMRWWVLVLALVACGKGASGPGEKKVDLDADPIALLPGFAVVVATVDARAIFDSSAVGGQLAALAGKLFPLGENAGFEAQRDVDRIALADYASGGIDVVAVMSGRFDPDKIAASTTASGGAAIVRGAYAGRATYTAGTIAYVVLTPKTLVAGTGEGLRRLLDRVQAGTIDRAIPPWMVETLDTKGAQLAAAADFETQPVASAAIESVNVPWLKGMRTARVIGNFAPPGMNVAATLSYKEPQQAQAAADGVRSVDGWLRMLGPLLGGMRLQNLDVTTEAQDLHCKFAVDDQTLRSLLALAPRFLPMAQ
jgi:hypothetical protein